MERPKWENEEIKNKAMKKLQAGEWKIEKGKLIKEDGSVIKLKPDTELRDHENIPFLREENGKLVKQTIEEYFDGIFSENFYNFIKQILKLSNYISNQINLQSQ